MKKTIINDEIYYTLAWSPIYPYDKYEIIRILPELPGILCILQMNQNRIEPWFYFSCWRDGCRLAMKKLFDPYTTILPILIEEAENGTLYFMYTIIDTSDIRDLQDILYWLIKTHEPRYNDYANYKDSKRFKNIYINEIQRKPNDTVEKIHGHR